MSVCVFAVAFSGDINIIVLVTLTLTQLTPGDLNSDIVMFKYILLPLITKLQRRIHFEKGWEEFEIFWSKKKKEHTHKVHCDKMF